MALNLIENGILIPKTLRMKILELGLFLKNEDLENYLKK